MTSRIIVAAVAGILVFLFYAFAVPALLSADSVACILLGLGCLVAPVVVAIALFVETFKGTRNE